MHPLFTHGCSVGKPPVTPPRFILQPASSPHSLSHRPHIDLPKWHLNGHTSCTCQFTFTISPESYLIWHSLKRLFSRLPPSSGISSVKTQSDHSKSVLPKYSGWWLSYHPMSVLLVCSERWLYCYSKSILPKNSGRW
jgi:hypothetical protein